MIIFQCINCGKIEKNPSIIGCKCRGKMWQSRDAEDIRAKAIKIIKSY